MPNQKVNVAFIVDCFVKQDEAHRRTIGDCLWNTSLFLDNLVYIAFDGGFSSGMGSWDYKSYLIIAILYFQTKKLPMRKSQNWLPSWGLLTMPITHVLPSYSSLARLL